MDNNLFTYLELALLLIFFSGYPLIYVLIRAFAKAEKVRDFLGKDISIFLAFAYALTGVLYWGLQIKNLFPVYSFVQLKSAFELPILQIWALLSVLFFIPLLNRKPVYSLLHSFVFFFFITRDLILFVTGTVSAEVIKNNMRVFTYSVLINLASFVFIVLIYLLLKKITAKQSS